MKLKIDQLDGQNSRHPGLKKSSHEKPAAETPVIFANWYRQIERQMGTLKFQQPKMDWEKFCVVFLLP